MHVIGIMGGRGEILCFLLVRSVKLMGTDGRESCCWTAEDDGVQVQGWERDCGIRFMVLFFVFIISCRLKHNLSDAL